MHELFNYVCDELKDLEKKAKQNGLTMQEIQYGDTLAHFGKNLEKIMDEEDGYSGGMIRDGRGSYRWDDGMSYARGRGRNAKRDSMGRYSSEGYSRAADEMADRMRSFAQDAPDDRTRREIEQMADRMETM